MNSYAIGDIHGCNRTFNALLDMLPLQSGDRLILLGDYIDRGPDSKGVIDTIFRLREAGFDVVCLRGNHEEMLLELFADGYDMSIWLFNGGRSTMASFGTDRLRDIAPEYRTFLRSTLFYYETPGYIFVHGGLRFGNPDPLSPPRDLLWLRHWYADIDYAWLGDRIIVHGHTPESIETIEAQHARLARQQYLNLDNGCVYAGYDRGPGLGRLLAFCLETKVLYSRASVE